MMIEVNHADMVRIVNGLFQYYRCFPFGSNEAYETSLLIQRLQPLQADSDNETLLQDRKK